MTQRDVAGDVLSVSYVSLIEAGRRSPTRETIQLLASALGCSEAELTGEQESPATRPAALDVRFGQLALAGGKTGQAQGHFENALRSPDLDPLLHADAVIGAAKVLESQGRLREAAQAYESLVQKAIDAPRYLASLRVVIGWIRCLYELGELARVTEIGMRTMQELDRLQAWQSDTAVELLATVAAAYFELGDLEQAERLLREGLDRAEQMHSPRARASVLWNASHLASERGHHREALDLAEEALVYFRHGSDRRSAARLLSQYGYLQLRQEPPRVAEARATLEEALALLQDHGIGYERGYVLTELSRAHLMQGDVATAIELGERSLAELGPEALLERARAQTALAAAWAAAGNPEQSTELFTAAANCLDQLQASRQAARAWVELGNVLAEAGDAQGAVEAFRKATASMHLGAVPTNVPESLSRRA